MYFRCCKLGGEESESESDYETRRGEEGDVATATATHSAIYITPMHDIIHPPSLLTITTITTTTYHPPFMLTFSFITNFTPIHIPSRYPTSVCLRKCRTCAAIHRGGVCQPYNPPPPLHLFPSSALSTMQATPTGSESPIFTNPLITR